MILPAKAAAQGAVAIVAQEPIDVPDEIAVVYVEDTREAMEDMAPFFFDHPSRKMRMIALTGTNGKRLQRILRLIYFTKQEIRWELSAQYMLSSEIRKYRHIIQRRL